MERFNKVVKHLIPGLLMLMFAFGLTLATAEEAQARGDLEFGGAFGFAGLYTKHFNDDNGFTFTLSLRYRALDWLALGIEQDLGGLFEENNTDWNGFYGATIFGAKFIYAVSSAELYGNLGIGAVYRHMSWKGPGGKSEWDDAWFGLRLGIGATYFVSGPFGIGLNFDYMPGFKDDIVAHFLRLQLHIVYKF